MADEASTTQPKAKKKLPMTAIIIAGVTVVQAAGFFFAFKMLGGAGPKESYGHEGEHYTHGEEPASQPTSANVEVPLLEKFRVPNNKTGRTYLYDFDIIVVVPMAQKDALIKLKTERAGAISDRMAQIIRGADPQILNEDDFKTLRLQMQNALAPIVEKPDMIQQVLIPRCVPIRSD